MKINVMNKKCKIQETWINNKCANNRGRLGCCLGFDYGKSWTLN